MKLKCISVRLVPVSCGNGTIVYETLLMPLRPNFVFGQLCDFLTKSRTRTEKTRNPEDSSLVLAHAKLRSLAAGRWQEPSCLLGKLYMVNLHLLL